MRWLVVSGGVTWGDGVGAGGWVGGGTLVTVGSESGGLALRDGLRLGVLGECDA